MSEKKGKAEISMPNKYLNIYKHLFKFCLGMAAVIACIASAWAFWYKTGKISHNDFLLFSLGAAGILFAIENLAINEKMDFQRAKGIYNRILIIGYLNSIILFLLGLFMVVFVSARNLMPGISSAGFNYNWVYALFYSIAFSIYCSFVTLNLNYYVKGKTHDLVGDWIMFPGTRYKVNPFDSKKIITINNWLTVPAIKIRGVFKDTEVSLEAVNIRVFINFTVAETLGMTKLNFKEFMSQVFLSIILDMEKSLVMRVIFYSGFFQARAMNYLIARRHFAVYKQLPFEWYYDGGFNLDREEVRYSFRNSSGE